MDKEQPIRCQENTMPVNKISPNDIRSTAILQASVPVITTTCVPAYILREREKDGLEAREGWVSKPRAFLKGDYGIKKRILNKNGTTMTMKR